MEELSARIASVQRELNRMRTVGQARAVCEAAIRVGAGVVQMGEGIGEDVANETIEVQVVMQALSTEARQLVGADDAPVAGEVLSRIARHVIRIEVTGAGFEGRLGRLNETATISEMGRAIRDAVTEDVLPALGNVVNNFTEGLGMGTVLVLVLALFIVGGRAVR